MGVAATRRRVSLAFAIRCAAALLGIALFSTSLDEYAFSLRLAPKPLYWIVALVVAAVAILVLEAQRPTALLTSPFAAWVLFFFLLTTAWALWLSPAANAGEMLEDRYRSLAIAVAFAVTFDDERTRRLGAYALVVAAVFGACVNLAEATGLVQFADTDLVNRTQGRSAGLFVNPNESGLSIVFPLSVAMVVVPRRWRWPLLVLAAAGVAATFSRGAQICFALLIVILIVRRTVGASGLAVAVAVALTTFAFAGDGIVGALESRGVLNENTWARVRFAQGDSGRTDLAIRAWHMFESAPLLGYGLGSTSDLNDRVSSHNMYLALAGEHGVLGLLAFPALLAALVVRKRRVPALPILLAVAGLFTHNVLSHRFVLLLVGFTAAHDGFDAWARRDREDARALAVRAAAGRPPDEGAAMSPS
jgi:O-antigen ligase